MMSAMDRNSVDWRGYIPAMVTPFTRDGDLDRDGFSELLEWLVGEGMHGIVVAGSSGEWFSLAADERIDLFRMAAKQVDGRIPVIGCCNAISPGESLAYARAAEESGLDGIIVAPPRRCIRRLKVAAISTIAQRRKGRASSPLK